MRTASIPPSFSILGFLLALFLLALLVSPFAYGVEDEFPVSPPWLKVGTYVEYKVSVDLFTKAGYATLRWECISLEGNVATLNVSHTASGAQPYMTPISPNFAVIRILTDTRELIHPNGTVIEKTYLWLPPFMKKDQKVVLEGKPPNETIGTVYWEGGSCYKTCQGYQEVIWMERMKGNKSLFRDVDYDMNTGILVHGPLPLSIVEALDVQDYIEYVSTIVDTNVSLGPQYLKAAMLHGLWDNLPIIIIIVIFVAALLLVRRRRKRQNPRNTLRLANQQGPTYRHDISMG